MEKEKLKITKVYLDSINKGKFFSFCLHLPKKRKEICIPYIKFIDSIGFRCYFFLVITFGSESSSTTLAKMDEYYNEKN